MGNRRRIAYALRGPAARLSNAMAIALPRHAGSVLLIVSATVLGLAGTDLVLPAVPALPTMLGGDAASAQLVLASYTTGTAGGLMLFGELGARFDQRRLLAGSLLAFALVSLLCRWVEAIEALIALRVLQGATGAAAAVFAPGLLRRLFDDGGAVRALGLLGSVEAMAPALAPVAGLWLLRLGGWQASFDLLALLGLLLAAIVWQLRRRLPLPPPVARGTGGYHRLIVDRVFLRYALSHACTLGGLLIFVFGAPTVFVTTLGGSITDFIIMQIGGVAGFAIISNLAGHIAQRFGAERTIMAGTALSAAGTAAMLTYALAGGATPLAVAAIFLSVNVGLGLRGPPGFHRAIVAAHGDDARGAALAVVAILLTTSLGTAAVAPFITGGLVPLALGAFLVAGSGVLLLALLPPLVDRPD